MAVPHLHRALVVLALVFAPGLIACDSDNAEGNADEHGETHGDSICAQEDRDDEFAIGLRKSGEAVTVSFVAAAPAPPAMDDNTWTVALTDLDGEPLTNASITAVTPTMPDHGHGNAVVPTATPTDTAGEFMITLNLNMVGLWDITLDIDAGGATDQVTFRFCVE